MIIFSVGWLALNSYDQALCIIENLQPTRLLLARNTFALLLYQQHTNNFNYPNEFYVRSGMKRNETEWEMK